MLINSQPMLSVDILLECRLELKPVMNAILTLTFLLYTVTRSYKFRKYLHLRGISWPAP